MEYQVIMAGHWKALAERVAGQIAKGWSPLGGVAVVAIGPTGVDRQFFQAMTRGYSPA